MSSVVADPRIVCAKYKTTTQTSASTTAKPMPSSPVSEQRKRVPFLMANEDMNGDEKNTEETEDTDDTEWIIIDLLDDNGAL
jgi:hypothetical protein